MPQVAKTPAPITHLRSESDVSHLIVTEFETTKNTPIGEIEVKSNEQPHVSLGDYTSINPPKGFVIHISPSPEPDAIVTQITSLGTDEKYELVLHIANYGSKAISAEVWQI
jgi:hypothetical protein